MIVSVPDQTTTSTKMHYGPRLPRSLVQTKQWLVQHHMTLMTINDTPHSVALGSAIGVFFGFTPLFSLKTLLSIAVAWIFRANKIAAIIAVTVHDVLIFAMPAIYFAEYKAGCWLLRRPPPHRIRFHFSFSDYAHWDVFARVASFIRMVWPALVGSMLIAVPSALLAYFIMRMLVSRARTSPAG